MKDKVRVWSAWAEINQEVIIGGGKPSVDVHLARKIRCTK